MLNKKFIAIIPARGGSKQIKNKNIKKFLGKPLIHWTIEAAINSNSIDKIYVSTDSNLIVKKCEKFKNKITILKRPKNLAKDNTKMLDVIKNFSKNNFLKKKNFLGLIILQPTSPLRNYLDIKQSCKLFLKNKPDSLISINKINHQHNPESIYKKNGIFIKKYNNKKFIPLRQKKKEYFASNGAAIYITNKKNLNKFIIGGKKIIGYEMPVNRSIDIDTKFDFEIAEMIKKNEI